MHNTSDYFVYFDLEYLR